MGRRYPPSRNLPTSTPTHHPNAAAGNYFATTIANVFASRRAFLHADANTTSALASATVHVKQPGSYSVLARYEGVYHHSAGFRLEISQAGKVVFNRRYGMRENLKLWAFAGGRMSGGAALNIPGTCPKGELLAAECSWTYGATENVLWEGVGAQAALSAGPATITLTRDSTTTAAAGPNTTAVDGGTADADLNLDTILLHPNATDVMSRATTFESHDLWLPLDGLLSQQGEVYFKIHAPGPGDVNMTVPPTAGPEAGTGRLTQAVWDNAMNKLVSGCPGPLCPQIFVAEGATSAWVEVGRVMSPFNPAP